MKEKFNFQVEGVPLIKFQDAEKIKKLQSGKIYAKTLGYYRKREEETGDCEVGDKYEGMTVSYTHLTLPTILLV